MILENSFKLHSPKVSYNFEGIGVHCKGSKRQGSNLITVLSKQRCYTEVCCHTYTRAHRLEGVAGGPKVPMVYNHSNNSNVLYLTANTSKNIFALKTLESLSLS